MKEILLLCCSPHKGGVSDRLTQYFARGLAEGENPVRTLALRDFNIRACDGCNKCVYAPYTCIYEEEDNLAQLFSALREAALAVMISPIYFYALPALCAAFIDRAQCLWNSGGSGRKTSPFAPGIAILAAGRSRGKKLFTGASLSLTYFFKAGGASLLATYAFGGLENPAKLEEKERLKDFLYVKGKQWASYVSLNDLGK